MRSRTDQITTTVVLVLLGLSMVVTALVVSAPASSSTHLDPASTGPGGTRALIELVAASGVEPTVTTHTPAASVGVALLLADTTSRSMTAALEEWVRGGGTLVVADPGSSFVPAIKSRLMGFGLGPTTLGRGDCRVDALAAVATVVPGDAGALFEVPQGASACIASRSGAFVVDLPVGAGHLVSLGGADVFTNRLIGVEDNAVLAVSLLAPRPGTQLSVLWGMSSGASSGGLGGRLSTGVRLGLWELFIGFVAYALWRGRRLGNPVPEVQPVQIAGSELVDAVGRLLHQSRDSDRGAKLLRADLRRHLTERLGLGHVADQALLAQVTAERTGLEPEAVGRAVCDSTVRDDAELVSLALQIDIIKTEVLDGTHAR